VGLNSTVDGSKCNPSSRRVRSDHSGKKPKYNINILMKAADLLGYMH
jgi:hypothetical protein